MTDARKLAEAIGALMCAESNEETLKNNFDHYLNAAESSGIVTDMINSPIQRYYGRTLVHIAAFNGLPEYLEILLKKGGDPNRPSSPPDLCQTPLHLAAHQGFSQCIEVLLKHGAHLRAENTRRVTPVELARGKYKCEIMFRNAIAKVEIPNRSQEQLQRVKDLHGLLDEGGGNTEQFKLLYLELSEYERDLGTRWTDWFQQTLLYRAIDKRCELAVKFLLLYSSNVPLGNLGNGSTPLLAACYHSDISLVTLLLEHSPVLCFVVDEQTGLSPLHICCSRGNTGIVQKILQSLKDYFQKEEGSSVNLNMQDSIGRTPLFNACYHGRLDVVRDLLDFKMQFPDKLDVNVGGNGGRTALHAAVSASKNSKEIVGLLLKHSELNLNIEARPSSRANRYLLKLLKRNQHSEAIPVIGQDALLSLNGQQQGEYPISPPITCSPLESPYSDDRDIQIGILRSKRERGSVDSPVSPRFSKIQTFASTLSSRSRPTTPTTPPLTPPSSSVGVYQSDNGRLAVTKKFEEENTSFNNMSITPLAEACIFHNKEIVHQLLIHGALDKKALASQICSLIRQSELLFMILSRQCKVLDDECEEEEMRSSYCLQWDSKHLQTIKGAWLAKEKGSFLFHEQDPDATGIVCHPMSFKTIECSNIIQVSLSHNHLVNVPLELFQLPSVKIIDLSENNLMSLPEPADRSNSWSCDKLTTLNLSGNSLTYLPSCLWALTSLRQISARKNKLHTLMTGYDPSQDGQLSSSLIEINLASNELKVIPDFIFMFPSVTKVSLPYNSLVSLPKCMWYQHTLQELNISNNKLDCLPFCEADELNSFGVHDEATGIFDIATPLNDLNVTLTENASFQASMRSNRKTFTHATRIKRVTNIDETQPDSTIEQSCDYSNLLVLNMSKNEFINFPTGLPCLAPNLVELNISDNRIQCIDVIFLPQLLRKLIAKNCMIQRVGNTLMEKQLKYIRKRCYHSDESAICLHRSHTMLHYLQTLDLSGNEIQCIQLLQHAPLKRKTQDASDDELRYQQNINVLKLLYPSLEGLNLSNNRLVKEFNPNIGRQTQLKWIRLSGNSELERLPLEIAYLKNVRSTLTELEIRNLPNLVEPPAEYHKPEMQVGQILTYLRSKLKHSVPYRTMKLFLIGKGERGKTTLLRRLKESAAGVTERTTGIDIEYWDCRGKTRMFSGIREPIRFLAWDFAGQDVYHVTHQLFYSKRALYLAVFRLSDGIEGVNELDPWLRNVQLRAPGCIVIIVGTHLDQVSESERMRIEKEVEERFSITKRKMEYPKVVGCICVSCVNRFLTNNIDSLRQYIYDVASKLKVVAKDGDSLEYKSALKENDPHALLQQQIPATFLKLQEEVHKIHKDQPKMNDKEFFAKFRKFFDDDEELNEAVHYLTLQGTLLHYEDPGLRKLYFLDPEWLAKLMARLISPTSEKNDKIVDGRVLINDLFKDGPLSFEDSEMSRSYLQLLQKFELALRLNEWEILIPSLLPREATFPQPDESLEDVLLSVYHNDLYQPPVRRFWLSNYIPEGFWPRLICRVYKDHQINTTLMQYVNLTRTGKQFVEWKTWQQGMVFSSRGRTLIVLKLLNNDNNNNSSDGASCNFLQGKYRIELHVFIPEMIRIIQELQDLRAANQDEFKSAPLKHHNSDLFVPFNVTGHATMVMVAISNHIVSLSSWFSGMVSGDTNGYVPCWKCSAGIKETSVAKSNEMMGSGFVTDNKDRLIYSLSVKKCIVPACQGKDLRCVVHKDLKTVHLAPDLVFWDLKRFSDFDSPQTLDISDSDSDRLGKGGFGFVCKGQLSTASSSEKQPVAVKVFLDSLGSDRLESCSTSDLIAMSKKPEQLFHSYREIRQEVSFLASLDHPNITKLQGVMTKPTLCLILELAPKKSLRAILKEYREKKHVLEPLTLKQSANQIAEGLEYLHSNQIVHLDMKSPNVLAWHFPSANSTKQERVRDAGNVWLKLADYGISQVATTMLMRIGSSPIGTPGYMAPEMFECVGQEVSADKIDVFAYGMVLYELISLQAPFSKQPVQKRNHDIVDGKRPPVGSQEKHAPLCIQDLMRLCWSHDPSHRPTMKQCVAWTSSNMFDRLRTEITLGSCASIACACVSRIEPEMESEWTRDNALKTEVNGTYFTKEEIDKFGSQIDQERLTSQLTESIIERASNSFFTNSTEDELTKSDDSVLDPPLTHHIPRRDSIYVTDTSLEVATNVTKKLLRKVKERRPRPSDSPIVAARATVETSYSQIWMCGRDKKKGLLAVFILPDNQKHIYRFFGYIGNEEIQVLCPIRNSVWMGTSKGSIRIVHAPTLSVKYSSKIGQGDSSNHSPILKILHVEEENCVLVASHNLEVWCFHDCLVGEPCCLMKRQRIVMDDREDCGPVYDLVKVVTDGKVRVWGTMDNNVLVQFQIEKGVWSKTYHSVTPYNHHMKVCSYIVCCSFVGLNEREEHHLWVSYRSKSGIMCLDARTGSDVGYINCSEVLQTPQSNCNHQVSTILAEGRRLIVGTSDGLVAIFDSETRRLLSRLNWHQEKLRSLLILPEQIKPSICAELDFNTDITSPINAPPTNRHLSSSIASVTSSSSCMNKHFIANQKTEGPLLASIGNGRRRMNITDNVDLVDQQNQRTRANTMISEDITLLIWHT